MGNMSIYALACFGLGMYIAFFAYTLFSELMLFPLLVSWGLYLVYFIFFFSCFPD